MDAEIIEYIMQLRISKFIKENRDMDKDLLLKEVEKLMDTKKELYNMEQEELEKILKNEKMEN